MNSLSFIANPASSSERRRDKTLLMSIDRRTYAVGHRLVADLPSLFRAGDVLVVNDAATLPSSLLGTHRPTGRKIEIRLAVPKSDPADPSRWTAVLFGEGDWRTPTEKRVPPPLVMTKDRLDFAGGLSATVLWVHGEISARFLEVEFDVTGARLWSLLYSAAKPVQYSHQKQELAVWDPQTLFAGPAVALEPPSASFALTWDLMAQLHAQGVTILKLTHGTGLSHTGDDAIDRRLPLPERYHLSREVQAQLQAVIAERRPIIAVGTGVVRALESWAGKTREGWQHTELRLVPGAKLRIVSGLLTGLHDAHASHIDMLGSFVDSHILERAYVEASQRGYRWHEYGDVCLIR